MRDVTPPGKGSCTHNGHPGRMTAPSLANPRRSTLASLAKGSELATCEAERCHNVAVLVQSADGGRRLVCRAHASR